MKMTRKLIPAFVMLIVSAIMLSTASYAWFATQTTVTASDMSVKAKAEAKYLWISGDDGHTWKTAAEAAIKTAEVSLVSAVITNKKDVSWFYAAGANPNAPTMDPSKRQDLGVITADYALINTFLFKADAGSINLANLTIKSITVSGNVDDPMKGALRILAVSDTGAQLWKPTVEGWDPEQSNPGTYSAWTMDSSVSATALAASLTPGGSPKSITVYAYYDGEDASAYTNNANNLKNASISITFGVDN